MNRCKNLKSFTEEKKRIVKYLKRAGFVRSDRVINAFLKVPREEFVRPEYRKHAYDDTPLPIGCGQTISAIHMVLMMCEYLDLKPGHKVLEVGTGSGYHAAIIAELITSEDGKIKGHVYTIERIPELAKFATENLKRTKYDDRVTIIVGDGTLGYPEKAPYDRICVTAAGPDVPKPLIEQLKNGGKLLIPIGAQFYWQELYLIEKDLEGKIKRKNLGGVAFVPLIGKYGWNSKG
ncbi:MAG: protein-L-isoaspartate O-methyltransferase [Candidatus Asgardarchaeum sp.]